MALRGLGRELYNAKLKDVPSLLSSKLTRANLTDQATVFAADYKRKYFDEGSIKPLQHMIIGTFLIAYAVAWPTEYRHYKHAQARARAWLGSRRACAAGCARRCDARACSFL